MKILLVTDEEWNDAVFGNNVLTNWFNGFDAEFAQIYCSPGIPYNNICERYYQITDSQMARSLLHKGENAGSVIYKPETREGIEASKTNAQRQGYYRWLKKMSLYVHTPMMMARDAIWMWGKYDKEGLHQFVNDFNPDIVFCPRMVTPKLMRLEEIVSSMTKAPFVAFTADNEASLNHYSWSPLFWLRAWMINRAFIKHVGLYKHYFMFSDEQAQDYNRKYGITTSTLYKCGHFKEADVSKEINNPIRMVYAGRLYCNRWKTLVEIGRALEKINKKAERMILDIYTADDLTRTQRKAFKELHYVHVKAPITPAQLIEEYHRADIALHVESFDRKYRAATRYSFSTKIIDLMASSCAIMAICWVKHAGYQYLKQHDAAICVPSYEEILPTLEKICERPSLVIEYAKKALLCGQKNHSREKIQNQIRETFYGVVRESKSL